MRRNSAFALAAALSLSLAGTLPHAHAVVIASGNGSGNTTVTGDPAFADAFAHVGRRGNNSAVYLGHGVVLTAWHASGGGGGNINIGGTNYAVVAGSKTRLHAHDDENTLVDLALFRISGYTGLEPLTIGSAPNDLTNPVRIAGFGYDRAADLLYWNVTQLPGDNNDVWTPVPGPVADAAGFGLLGTQSIRWGENHVAGNGPDVNNTKTKRLTFNTADDGGATHEAQAVAHDSGGAVFRLEDSQWLLVGTLLATGVYDNQPADTAVFGNETYFANLSLYLPQILAYIPPILTGDANHDGVVDTLDFLAVEQHFGALGVADGTLPGDANGDGRVDGADLLAIERNQGATLAALLASLDASASTGIPEPAAALIFLALAPLLTRPQSPAMRVRELGRDAVGVGE